MNLKGFIDSIGFVGLISEHAAFPVDPHAGTAENCRRVVRERADIFVLVVGARYGTQQPSGKSVTNLEYLEARAAGVPIYVFVSKSILATLPVWKANPTADFSGTVDDVKLFEFVDQLRGADNKWVFGFDHADDIIATLRQQWALLFSDALHARERLRANPLSPALQSLSPAALGILWEKPFGWEYRLFAAILRDQLASVVSLRHDLRFGIALGSIQRLRDPHETLEWFQTQLAAILKIVGNITQIFNVALQEALGPSGVAGNPDLIEYVARRAADTARAAVNWSLDFTRVDVDEPFKPLMAIASEFSRQIVDQIWEFPNRLDAQLQIALEAKARGDPMPHLRVTIEIDTSDVGKQAVAEIERLRREFGV